ncbi:MAG: hypothetical protein MJ209_00105 [archaeon]|nr:hypothetical protein [archaeon]
MTQWLKFVNQGGIPAIQCVGVNTTGTITTFSFNDHPYRQTNRFYGFFVVKFPNPITETATNTVKFDTQGVGGSTVDVYNPTGSALEVTDLTSTAQTVRLFFYDRDSNRVQLIW